MKILKFSLGTIFIVFVTLIVSVFVALFTVMEPMTLGRPMLWTIWYLAMVSIGCMALYDFSPFSNKQVRRIFTSGLLFGIVIFISLKSYYTYIDGLRIEERGVELTDYQPFTSSPHLATLDHSAVVPFEEGVPRLDGATALYPLYASFVQELYPASTRYDPYNDQTSSVVSTTTSEAYHRLVAGETDIIFVAGPSKRQREEAKRNGVSLHMTAIGKEGFVFFVHKDNPIETLTLEQVRGIYAGDILNWKEVGGKSDRIRAFQRPEDSGSQTALQWMMGNQKLMHAPVEDVAEGMGGIIQQTSDYQNHQNALGFSFRYYATEMVKKHDIKLLKIEGVAPTIETIQNGTYPLTSEFYAVTTETKAEQYDAFLKWMISSDGQLLVERTGYVRLK